VGYRISSPLLIVVFLFSSLCVGETIDREAFVEAFIKKADIVRAFDERIAGAEADVSRAKWQYFPKLKLIFGVAPFPRYTYNPDNVDWDKSYYIGDIGIALRARGEFSLPIYTFGKITNAIDAAEKGADARRAEKEISLLSLRKEASSFYYTYLMMNDVENILDLSLEKVAEAEEKLLQWLDENKEGASQSDLIKLRIEKERLLAGKDKVTATKKSLEYLFEKILGPGYVLKDTFMFTVSFSYTLEQLEAHLVGDSPYQRFVTNGIGALESLYKFEKSQFFPNLGIAGDYRIDYTSSVDDRGYPLPSSPYNGYGGEIGIGLELNLNFLDQVARMRKAKAEWEAKRYEASFAREKAIVELRRAYGELKALEQQVEHAKKANKLAKGWMTTELLNYGVGMFSTRDLVDAVKAFVENEYQLITAMYEYNMKVEEVLQKAGIPQ